MVASPAEAGNGRVVLVVALAAEARPLIERFGLTPRAGSSGSAPFRVFEAGATPLCLVISGVGRVAAGAAVAFVAGVAGRCGTGGTAGTGGTGGTTGTGGTAGTGGTGHDDEPEKTSAWLNVGVAGHRDRAPGQAVIAHRVIGPGGASWYPPLVFPPPCPTATVHTVDTPCLDYPGDELYDMEAAGFFQVATRCATRELVHCLKVVSDNRDHPASHLDAARVGELVETNVEIVAAVIERIAALSGEQSPRGRQPPGYDELLSSARFSATRRRQLRRTLRRWHLLCGDADPSAWIAARGVRDAGAVLAALEQHLDGLPPVLEGRATAERESAGAAQRDGRLPSASNRAHPGRLASPTGPGRTPP
jgi:hypothetical protein